MSMPIQRQSESFGIFDDGPRYARDKGSHDLPKGLAALINTSGPRIQAGMLNTRTASGEGVIPPQSRQEEHDLGRKFSREEHPSVYWQDCSNCLSKAMNRHAGWHTPDYDPRVDGYAEDYGDRPSAADFAEEDAERERQRNYPRGQGAPWDYDTYGDPDPDLENLEETADPKRFLPGDHVAYRRASRLPFDRAAAARLAKDGESCRRKHGFADPSQMQAAPQVPIGGGFLPGHRVGLDWRDRTIPGTVIANDGKVHIRWDEGQYTSEDPHEVHLL